MPYVIITAQSKDGPTCCGDERQDPNFMKQIGATLIQEAGQSSKHYVSPNPPRLVLNWLQRFGYDVVSSTGCGQVLTWTCYLNVVLISECSWGSYFWTIPFVWIIWQNFSGRKRCKHYYYTYSIFFRWRGEKNIYHKIKL